MIRPIPTNYSGCLFRSRIEARWAIFFDFLDIKWQYELEGFELPSGIKYLPDFWLPDMNCFAEVKGGSFIKSEESKCVELSYLKPVLLLDGPPDFKSYKMIRGGKEESEIIFISKGSKYFPFFYSYQFNAKYFTETTEAVTIARSQRFEFHGQ